MNRLFKLIWILNYLYGKEFVNEAWTLFLSLYIYTIIFSPLFHIMYRCKNDLPPDLFYSNKKE